jgi:hypothetical protein
MSEEDSVADDLETPASPVSAGPALNITFTAPLDEPYLRRHVRHLLWRHSLSGILLSLCLLGIAILCFMAGGQAVFPGLVNLGLAFMFLFWLGFPVDRYLRSLPAHVYGPRGFVISDSELTVSSATASSRMTWETFKRAEQRSYAFVLYLYGQQACDVPRTPLTDEQDEQLRQFLIGRGLLRAARNGGAERDDE